MTTRYVARTREGWRLKRLLGLALVVGSGLAIAAFALAARSVGHSDEPELGAYASELAPAPVPVPTPPPVEEQPYVTGTPAVYTPVTAKLQPQWVAVPTPPVSKAPAAPSGQEHSSAHDTSRNSEGTIVVVPGALIILTIFGLLAWVLAKSFYAHDGFPISQATMRKTLGT